VQLSRSHPILIGWFSLGLYFSGALAAKDNEIASLRSHITEALALVPSSMYDTSMGSAGQYTTPKLGSPTMVNSQTYVPTQQEMMFPMMNRQLVIGSPR